MKKAFNQQKKRSPTDSSQQMKNHNCMQMENITPPQVQHTKLSKQSYPNSISAFKPYGITNESPLNNNTVHQPL